MHHAAAVAMLAEAHGDPEVAQTYANVAERLGDYGDPFEQATALLGQARLTGASAPRERATTLLEGLGVRS
jgi:hypothetical protein